MSNFHHGQICGTINRQDKYFEQKNTGGEMVQKTQKSFFKKWES